MAFSIDSDRSQGREEEYVVMEMKVTEDLSKRQRREVRELARSATMAVS